MRFSRSLQRRHVRRGRRPPGRTSTSASACGERQPQLWSPVWCPRRRRRCGRWAGRRRRRRCLRGPGLRARFEEEERVSSACGRESERASEQVRERTKIVSSLPALTDLVASASAGEVSSCSPTVVARASNMAGGEGRERERERDREGFFAPSARGFVGNAHFFFRLRMMSPPPTSNGTGRRRRPNPSPKLSAFEPLESRFNCKTARKVVSPARKLLQRAREARTRVATRVSMHSKFFPMWSPLGSLSTSRLLAFHSKKESKHAL